MRSRPPKPVCKLIGTGWSAHAVDIGRPIELPYLDLCSKLRPGELKNSTPNLRGHVARILADKDIRKLIGSVLCDADEKLINPNGLELRLGRHVLFHSTSEEAELDRGQFLKVSPGESVAISSVELIDFKAETVHKLLPNWSSPAFMDG